MSSRRVGQDAYEWGDAPTQAVLLTDHLALYKGAQDPQLCQRMIWFGSCYEDKLWEREVCSGSKKRQAQPESKLTAPKVMCSNAAQPTEGDGRKDVIK